MNDTKIIACRTLEEEIRSILPPGVDCEFMEYALHNTPDKLRRELQEAIDNSPGYKTLLFGYGLCSNGLVNLKGRQTMVIPRVHDCISLLLGSRERYDAEFGQWPATYYLSNGWIRQQGDPLSSFHRYCEKYGEETAKYVIHEEYKNYQRVAFIHTTGNSTEEVAYSRKVAEFLNVKFVELQGSLLFFEKLLTGDWEDWFFVIPPGGHVTLTSFF
jgi:hypothetical protein